MADSHNKPDHSDNNASGGSQALDRMEDDFYVLCAAIRRECDESMRREEGHEEENFSVCQKATGRYDAEAVPAFNEIVRLAGYDSPTGKRARERAASCLHGLALNHVWAGRHDMAESLTQRAKELAPEGSLVLSRIEDTVFSPASVAHGVRKVSTEEHADGHGDKHGDDHAHSHEKPHSGKGYGVWVAAAVGLVFGIVVVVFTGKAPKVATAPAPLHAPEKPVVASPSKEDAVAKAITESVTHTAPPSAKDLHLKHPEEKTKPLPSEVKKTEPPAQSVAVTQKASPEPPKPAPVKAAVVKKAEDHQHQGATKVKESKKTVAEQTPRPRVTKSTEVKKPPVTANESRAVTLGTLLGQTEAKLNKLLKDLENKEAQIASRRSTLEVYEQKKGTDSADYRKIGEEYNRLIREYNKQLAEANKVAAEHEALLKEYRQLSGSQNN